MNKTVTALTRIGAMVICTMMIVSGSAVYAAGPGGEMPGPGGDMSGSGGGQPGGTSSSVTWTGSKTITGKTTESGKTYSSTNAGENAVLIDTSEAVTLKNSTVTKTGGTSAGDSESFYGTNSAIMCKGGGTTTITGANITTDAAGANGVFSYGGNASTNASSGDGTTVKISDSTITTTGNGSGGIMTTGQGTTEAENLKITTSGASSAAIRSDRGGGVVNVTGGSYKTSGVGSPAVYATATVTVNNATLTSTASQGIVNEGGNKVYINNCTLNAGNSTLNSQDYFRNGIFLYQSMSGDASDGASVFTMKGGSLNNTYGHVFHVTNTSAAITLDDVDINNSDSDNVFLSVCDDAWSGLANKATLNATDQIINGDILVGSDSTANINLSGSSVWTGRTNGKITSHKDSSTVSTSLGTVNVKLSDDAVWVLTGDCSVSSISGSGKINYNGYILTVGNKSYSSGSPGVNTITETSESGSQEKADQNLKVSKVTRTVKYNSLKKKTQTVKGVAVSNAKGTVTYSISEVSKKSFRKYFSINSTTGKVTVKKGLKKGTYKITVKVNAAATKKYKADAGTAVLTVKVR